MEYSITAEELQEILDLVANGWNCQESMTKVTGLCLTSSGFTNE